MRPAWLSLDTMLADLEINSLRRGCNAVTGLKLKGSTFADGAFGGPKPLFLAKIPSTVEKRSYTLVRM